MRGTVRSHSEHRSALVVNGRVLENPEEGLDCGLMVKTHLQNVPTTGIGLLVIENVMAVFFR